jgi:NAD(P)-dependent dehydrogenase (short-subunit alcohol dehydrogenase family)
MQKTILITGSTDGIGLEAGKTLASMGHNILLHGRNPSKLEQIERTVSELAEGGRVESYLADLSRIADVEALAKAVTEKHDSLDVLINNAGIFKTPNPITYDGLDVRFAVNTIAPYLLT